MNTENHIFNGPVDVHAALARAHADRGEYISMAFAEVPALLKRLLAAVRHRRHHTQGKGAWA